MSWLEKVQNELTIRCGDGKSYTPNYLNAQKSIEFQIAEFDFPDIDGTLVKRKATRGNKYPLEIYFQGEDHLDISEEFEISARDSRPWVISHPYYGELNVQPVSLKFDNTDHNLSKITGTVIETLEKARPSAVESPIDEIINNKVEVDEQIAQDYANNVVPTPSDITSLSDQNEILYQQGQQLSTGQLGAEYFNLFNDASAAIDNLINEPLNAMRTIQAVITAPSLFIASVEDRIRLLTDQFNTIVSTLTNLVTPNQKRAFQATGGTMMTTMAQAVVNGEYQTSNDVLNMIDVVLVNYNTFIESVDQLQTNNAGNPESYIPDIESMMGIDNIINEALSNLFDIALEAQQERQVIITSPSNPIILTHRFYGLDNADENLQRFIESNNLSLNQLIEIPAGSTVIYYV